MGCVRVHYRLEVDMPRCIVLFWVIYHPDTIPLLPPLFCSFRKIRDVSFEIPSIYDASRIIHGVERYFFRKGKLALHPRSDKFEISSALSSPGCYYKLEFKSVLCKLFVKNTCASSNHRTKNSKSFDVRNKLIKM